MVSIAGILGGSDPVNQPVISHRPTDCRKLSNSHNPGSYGRRLKIRVPGAEFQTMVIGS